MPFFSFPYVLLHDGVEDVGGDDGDGDDTPPLLDEAANLLVLDPHHVLAVDLQQLVVDEQPVPSGGGVHGDGGDPSVLELETDVTGGVLSTRWQEQEQEQELTLCSVRVLSKGRSLTASTMLLTAAFRRRSCTCSPLDGGRSEGRSYLVGGEAGETLSVDLEDLVTEAESAHGRRGGAGHQADKDALVDRDTDSRV